ncbi:MAG: FAD-dependent oxidoreductase, partial [Pseudomonadales bacterium]
MNNRVTPAPEQERVSGTIRLDIAILGGGIAGLWLVNRLQQAGYSTCLIERHGLGGEQTLASQGMIHGGIKYTLGGALTNASETIAAMPERWQACLRGEG